MVSNENRDKGTFAEQALMQWLDISNMPYVYTDQKYDTYPRKLVAHLKRPDFLVGVTGLGSLAVEVKGYTRYENTFAVELQEVQRLASFQKYFNMTVFYSFIPPEHRFELCWLISNDEFERFGKTTRLKGKSMLRLPSRAEDCYDMTKETFMAALGKQIEHEPEDL